MSLSIWTSSHSLLCVGGDDGGDGDDGGAGAALDGASALAGLALAGLALAFGRAASAKFG